VIVFALIAPHGDPAFVEGSPTNVAVHELGRRHRAAAPDATIVLTPHNVHVDGAFGVITAGTVSGRLDDPVAAVTRPVDRELAGAVLDALHAEGLPAVGVSYGSNDPAIAEVPLDWGALIPLWFLGGEEPVVVVVPARDLALADHVRAGRAIASASAARRVSLVASADHGHRHDAEGPFGLHPASAEYDRRVVELIREDRLSDVLELEPIVDDAYADSLWQLAMLAGAIDESFVVELLSYEAPTYFGMLTAAYTPASSGPSGAAPPALRATSP
jgi:aromatic ring-opening dioxygenase LigB subunit